MMPSILRDLATLQGFALSNVLLAFDYDGTLAPIAATPGAARMRAETRHLLQRVASCYPCVVISGRALDDVTRRLAGVPVWYVFGNHGLEPAGGRPSLVSSWRAILEDSLPDTEGLVIEDKGHSITIHYRDVHDKAEAMTAIQAAIAALPGARALPGVEAISLLPGGARHKGIALQEARRRFSCDTAMYVGDDGTDEDAFASAGPEQLLSIRVGRGGRSKARYCLERQQDIDTLLRVLVATREGQWLRRRPDETGPAT
jgi:trehalose 6-phosphate phosphatase